MAKERPRTLGELRASGYRFESVKDEMRRNLIARVREGRAALPGHPRLRGDRRPPDPERHPLEARHALPRPPRPGQDADAPPARPPARRRDADRRGLGGQRPPVRPPVADSPATSSPRRATTRPIEWVGREDRYQEKLATPDVTIADLIGEIDMIKHAEGRYLSSELTMHFGLIPRTNRGHLLHQRAARPLAQDPGRPVQRARRARRPDPRLPDPAEPRPLHGLLGQPRGLHQPRPDRHAAEGPDRLGRPHALPADPRAGHRHQRPERLARPRRPAGWRSRPTSRRSSRRSSRLARTSSHVNQQSGVVGPDVDRQPRERGLQRRAARPDQRRAVRSCRGSPTWRTSPAARAASSS